jgi:quercetin dioxygenase-like cupin family protein
MSNPLVVTADQAPAPLKMVGEEITVLASGEQTSSYEIFRQSGPEGSGPPPHSHPWDEAFYVIEGRVHFGVGDDQDLIATLGTLVHIPGGTTHWFRFGPGGGAMISITSGAGASAFFTQVDAEVSPTNPDLGALIGIAAAHGLNVPVPSA